MNRRLIRNYIKGGCYSPATLWSYGKAILLVIFMFTGSIQLHGQTLQWKAGMNTFFDNSEFAGSSFKVPQTMAGVRFSPELRISRDTLHSISAGINMLHEFGSPRFLDKIDPVAYYTYRNERFRFLMGAFPRKGITDNYPRIFFQDSIYYYRPNISGIFTEYGKGGNHISVWLDWTGRRSETVREAFFAGIGGRITRGAFYLRHYGTYFHYFITSDPLDDEALHDNSLFLTSLGADLSGRFFLEKLDINIGWAAALERARGENSGWLAMNGLFSEVRAEYRFAGIFNTFYSGDGLMTFYKDHSNGLYWGDPVFRSRTYNRTDLYLTFFRNRNIDFQLTWSVHLMEGNLYNEQILKVGIDLNGK